jgi:hypothetical protein
MIREFCRGVLLYAPTGRSKQRPYKTHPFLFP